MSWVENELGEGALGDRRLTRRAKTLLDWLVSQPSKTTHHQHDSSNDGGVWRFSGTEIRW
jgi:hypothetical protein